MHYLLEGQRRIKRNKPFRLPLCRKIVSQYLMLVQYLARRQHVSLIMPQPSRNPNCTMHSPRPRGQHPRHAPVWTWNAGTWSIISWREGARRSQTHTELRASSLESVILIYDVGSDRRYFTHSHTYTNAHMNRSVYLTVGAVEKIEAVLHVALRRLAFWYLYQRRDSDVRVCDESWYEGGELMGFKG